jgi:sugar-specific transcriptional regulator TrmB
MVEHLVHAGLTSLQARVYVSALELGEAGATELAAKSGIKRVTVYTALNDLLEMNLITSDDFEAVRVYKPTPLENLDQHFMMRAKEAIQSYRLIQSLLPDLKQITKATFTDPTTTLIEGSVAVKQYIESVLPKELLHSAYINDQAHYELVKPLAKKAIDSEFRPKVIVPNSVNADLIVYLDHRVVPNKKVQFPATTLIFQHRVGTFLSENGMIQLYLQNDDRIAAQYQAIFDLEWRILSGEHLILPTAE